MLWRRRGAFPSPWSSTCPRQTSTCDRAYTIRDQAEPARWRFPWQQWWRRRLRRNSESKRRSIQAICPRCSAPERKTFPPSVDLLRRELEHRRPLEPLARLQDRAGEVWMIRRIREVLGLQAKAKAMLVDVA